MFIKPFKIKSNVQLKGSDIKKLKTRFIQQLKLSESDLSHIFPSKASYNSVKVITHGEQQVTIFTVEKRPMMFEINDRLYPTLYSLWINSNIVPYLTTHAQVLPKLYNGADLMLPGVIKEGSDLKSFGKFKKDDIVAVNMMSNSSAVGVGTLARSSEDLYMSGGHGVCVKMLHVFGDKLWGMEPSCTQQIPLSHPAFKAPNLNNENDFPALGSDQVKEMENIQSKLEDVSIFDDATSSKNQELRENSIQEQNQNPDDILKSMFLSALKLNRKDLSVSLPIQVGTFYPLYVQRIGNPNKPITVKDTSYKKLSTFMKKMSEEGFIVVREETKGVEKITSINYDHPEIMSHIPQKPNENSISCCDSNNDSTSHLLLTKMTELYVVNETTKKLFNALGIIEGKGLDKMQIKNHVKDYVARNKLINSLTKEVTLDDILVKICVGERENDGPIVMALDQIILQVMNSMDETFEMRSQAGAQIKGGRKPIIQITTAMRSGNKKVTIVNNLESYGVNIDSFSRDCKVGVQASTSITKVPGTNINQFQIQGNHVRFIYNLLIDTYKISRGDITGLEFAKKEKKKK